MPERAFTAQLARFFPASAQVQVGIGDDAAVVRNQHRQTVVCCDPVVQGVHFTAAAPLRAVGRKAVQRNFADLAAMGACPDYLVVSVVLPRHLLSHQREQLFLGLRDAANWGHCAVVGGDVAVSDGPLVVTVTACGHLVGKALLRSAARVGELLYVSGPLGGSAAGHHLSFHAPLAVGQWLARSAGVGGVLDVSDGLLVDLATMLAASGCAGAELHANCLPVRAAATARAKGDRATAVQHALTDGEDHVLLWSQHGALPSGGPLRQRYRRAIGRILPTPGITLVQQDGSREPLTVAGFQHALR